MKLSIPETEKLSAESQQLYNVINYVLSLDGDNNPCLDSVIVTLTTNFLDYALASLILKRLVKSSATDDLLAPGRGPVSSLVARVKLAYSLGLISKVLRENIVQIAEIRNQFAHWYTPLTLESPEVSKFVDKLTLPSIIHFGDPGGPERLAELGHRHKFITISLLALNAVMITALETQQIVPREKG